MIGKTGRFIIILTILLVGGAGVYAQGTRDRLSGNACNPSNGLNGVYRIDVDGSDKLYSVIEGATSSVPYGEQQQFFTDLAVRSSKQKPISSSRSRICRLNAGCET